MRSPRRFVPSALDRLEGRLVLSKATPTLPIDPPTLAQATSEALLVGQTVTDVYTTKEYNGLVQTNVQTTVLIKPNTEMVTQSITLAGSGGFEKTVEIETFSKTGSYHQYTTTEPNGTIQTEQLTEVYTKTGSTRTGKIERPDGVIITFTGKTVNKGTKSTTTESFVESNGIKYTEDNVSISKPNLTSSSVNTTKWSDGSIQISKSTTTDVRTL